MDGVKDIVELAFNSTYGRRQYLKKKNKKAIETKEMGQKERSA
ncbi:MAG: hypothetical protein OCD01_14230 [Fibrobacterales bacterium]